MEALEALEIISRGEDGRHQFKRKFNSAADAAKEMAAFSNSEGGLIFIGVDDDGTIPGLTANEIADHNELIANAATQNIRNPIGPQTQNLTINGRTVMVVAVASGADKPYFADGIIWQKVGADKRKITSKEELRRLFQASDLLQPDEIPVRGCGVDQLDFDRLRAYYTRRYKEELPEMGATEIMKLLGNLNLGQGSELNLAGLLLFGRDPQRFKPAFVVKAVRFSGLTDTGSSYLDSEDFGGRLDEQFKGALAFVQRNLPKRQVSQSFNTVGLATVPDQVLEELLVNALVHRNYLLNAPIRLFFFDDRIEILSPGSLPNHLTVEHVLRGNSSMRNSVLVSFAANGILPYRGIGTGIRRALELHPQIEFAEDRSGEIFRVTIRLSNT